MEEVVRLKNDLIRLKANSCTVGDSATAYQVTINIGGNSTRENYVYRWDIYVEPLANVENAIFTCVPSGGYMLQMGGDSSVWYPFLNTLYPMVDENDPYHFMVPVWYYNPTYIRIYGENQVHITSNVPFEVKSYSKTEIQIY